VSDAVIWAGHGLLAFSLDTRKRHVCGAVKRWNADAVAELPPFIFAGKNRDSMEKRR